jgi:hypothetical protein
MRIVKGIDDDVRHCLSYCCIFNIGVFIHDDDDIDKFAGDSKVFYVARIELEVCDPQKPKLGSKTNLLMRWDKPVLLNGLQKMQVSTINHSKSYRSVKQRANQNRLCQMLPVTRHSEP